MNRIYYERNFRTPYSESYYIVNDNNRLGIIDIHFTTTSVHGTLILTQEFDQVDIIKMIQQIDEDLVLSADVPRDDFCVRVYFCKDIGFYSDEYTQKKNSKTDQLD